VRGVRSCRRLCAQLGDARCRKEHYRDRSKEAGVSKHVSVVTH
jgi:hypothetical protein